MRALVVALVLLAGGCLPDFEKVEPFPAECDPRLTDPSPTCPTDGGALGYCYLRITISGNASITCLRAEGDAVVGAACLDSNSCEASTTCWRPAPDAGLGQCVRVCLRGEACGPDTLCTVLAQDFGVCLPP